MKIAIMQPYFLPYLGYFSLIKHTDRFIFFDTAQFIYHGWIERNRILKPKPNIGTQYIKVPLKKHSRYTKIKDIEIRSNEKWKDKIFAQLQHYKKRSPFYKETIELLKDIFNEEFTHITELNKRAIEKILNYLNIDRKIEIFSEMGLNIEEAKESDEWALNICKVLKNVDQYWNPPGGIDFFDVEKYKKEGIDIKFHKISLKKYNQRREDDFELGLSIIDVMMFNSPEDINEMLDSYELL